MWTDADRSRYRQAGDCLPSDLNDAEWERLAPLIPGEAGRTATQDRYAGGDERDLLSSSNRLPLALFAARGISAALDGLQYFPQVPEGGSMGGDLGRTAHGAARTTGAGGEPHGSVIDSQTLKAAEKGDARKVKQTQWVMTPARR